MNDNNSNQFNVKPVFQDAPPAPPVNTTPSTPGSSSSSSSGGLKGWIGNKKVIATILGLFVVFGGIGAGLVLVRQSQEPRVPAATPQGAATCGTTCDSNNDCSGGYQCNPANKKCALTICLANAITCSADDCTMTPQCGEYCGSYGNFTATCATGYTCQIDSSITPPPQFNNADLSNVGRCVLNACVSATASCTANKCQLSTSALPSATSTATATAVSTANPTSTATTSATSTATAKATTTSTAKPTTTATSTPKVVTVAQTNAPLPVSGSLTPTLSLSILGISLVLSSYFAIRKY